MAKVNIYPSITCSDGNELSKIADIKELGLKEVCYFPTPTTISDRKDHYKLLEASGIIYIPLVHIMSDMEPWEIRYFMDVFHTTAFNIHTKYFFPQINDLSAYKDIIYMETSLSNIDEELKIWAGVCPDFSHIEDAKYHLPEVYKDFMRYLEAGNLKIAHVSAIDQILSPPSADHTFKSLSDFDYLKNYSEYLPEIVALELENPIEQQLEAKKYIENMLSI
jgi:hypothetical protein